MATITGKVVYLQPGTFMLRNSLIAYVVEFDERTKMDSLKLGDQAKVMVKDPLLLLKQAQAVCKAITKENRYIHLKLTA